MPEKSFFLAVGLRHVLEHKHLVAEKFLLPEADGESFLSSRGLSAVWSRAMRFFHGERALV